MATLQDFIRSSLPYLLPQPRSRTELLSEAERLYAPKYDELIGETEGDFGQSRARLLEDTGLGRTGLNRSRSRLIEDFGTEEQQLQRAHGQQGMQLQERLATQGLNFGPGLGDLQREDLTNAQGQERLGFTRRRARGLEDIDTSAQALGIDESRGLSDLDRDLFRSRRGLKRDRASAIEGYVTDPRFVFPYA